MATEEKEEYRFKIIKKLKLIEQENKIKILRAAEVGSRASRLENASSDSDLVFIFIRPIETYLLIDASYNKETPDTILFENVNINDTSSPSPSSSSSSPSENVQESDVQVFDAQGYDLPKALKLLRDMSVMLVDSIISDIVYIGTDDDCRNDPQIEALSRLVRNVISECPSALARLTFQLLGKAQRHEKLFFNTPRERWSNKNNSDFPSIPVLYKKYFYVVLPLLRIVWLKTHPGQIFPPLQISQLLEGFEDIPHAFRTLIHSKVSDTLPLLPSSSIDDLDPWISSLFNSCLLFSGTFRNSNHNSFVTVQHDTKIWNDVLRVVLLSHSSSS